jgi:transposase
MSRRSSWVTLATSHPLHAAVLRFEPYDVDTMDVAREGAAGSQLPVHVRPAADEALVSWFWRLACRLNVSMSRLSCALMGTSVLGDDRPWCRASEAALNYIASRTGVDVIQLRAMTFDGMSSSGRDDEVSDRFCGRRFTRSGRRMSLLDRMPVCPACLRNEPYLRLCWMLGWVSVCSEHSIVLITHCHHCGQGLALPKYEPHTPISIGHCRADIRTAPETPAHVNAVRLEAALLLVKRQHRFELPAFGAIDWPVAVAVMDVLLSLVRIATTNASQDRLHAQISRDFQLPFHSVRNWSGRYGSSLTLAWLLQNWPRNLYRSYGILRSVNLGRVVARSPEMDEEMRESLRGLFRTARAKPSKDRFAGRRWIAGLPQTADELRLQAASEELRPRRARMRALAELREGRSVCTVAAAIGVTVGTIDRWLEAGASGGLEGALSRKGDRRATITSKQVDQIVHWMTQMPTRDRPPYLKALRASDVVAFAQQQFGIQMPHHLARRLAAAHCNRLRGWRRQFHVLDGSTRSRNIFEVYGTQFA